MAHLELFTALVGSHNYNLNNENSDRDYKTFIIPDFDDLYHKEDAKEKNITSEIEDIDYHDIRQMVYRFSKANVNFLEVLFSEEIRISPELPLWAKYAVTQIMSMKHDIVRMNLPYLYDACMGMKHNKLKLIDKGTQSSKHLVEKYGYDTKAAMSAYRILDFLVRFADNDFKDFKKAIWYTNYEKVLLNSILKGQFTKEEVLKLIANKDYHLDKIYKTKYKSVPFDEETYNKLEDILKDLVKHSILLNKK